jgi:hypothetical protein
MIFKLTRNMIKEITIGFKSLHKIPYILGPINGSHMLIVAPKVDPKSYCCQKGFYSTLIQGLCRCKMQFFGIMIMGGQEVSMFGFFSKK